MSAPENIPADVLEAARAHIAQGEMAIITVVNAILAERERCAQIADTFKAKPSSFYDGAEQSSCLYGQEAAAGIIATAIRIPTHPHPSQIAVSSADHAQTEPVARSGEKSAATNPEGDA